MIITICDSKTTASIDTLGAQLISMKDASGKEYIWQRDPAVWARCSPLLFPSVGSAVTEKRFLMVCGMRCQNMVFVQLLNFLFPISPKLMPHSSLQPTKIHYGSIHITSSLP